MSRVITAKAELERIKARDREQIAAMEDPRCDEQEHPGQGRHWHILQHPCGGYEQHDRCRGAETGRLRASGRRRDGRGSRRACVHGKRADEAGHDAAGAHPEEVAADVHLVASLVGERAGSRRRLGHDHQRDDGGDRRHAAQR